MNYSIKAYPRSHFNNETTWIYNTRKYISRYETYGLFSNIFGGIDRSENTLELLDAISDTDPIKDIKLTYIYTNFEGIQDIDSLLKNEPTKSFGIALSIETRQLENAIQHYTDDDFFLYLMEYKLSQKEMELFENKGFMGKLISRVIDKKKIMYTMLVNNLFSYLKQIESLPSSINETFITKYIEYGHFYTFDDFLYYLLLNNSNIHPLFSEMDCLSWDPFKKSRRYSEWLDSCSKLDYLIKFYLDIDSHEVNIVNNKNFLLHYCQYISSENI